MAHNEEHDGMTVGEQVRWWGADFVAFFVLLWFLIERYKTGRIYRGSAGWQARAVAETNQPEERQE